MSNGFVLNRFPHREYCYYTRRLVPLCFDSGATYSVSFIHGLFRHVKCSPSVFNSTLINGIGRYPNGPPIPLAVVNVERKKRSLLHCSINRVETYCGNVTAIDSASSLSLAILLTNSLSTAISLPSLKSMVTTFSLCSLIRLISLLVSRPESEFHHIELDLYSKVNATRLL